MPSIVSNAATEAALRKALESEGYKLSNQRAHGETGVDILATKGNARLFVEIIGHKSSPPARARDFYESFFRAISRTVDGAERCVIALPTLAGRGLPQRAKHYGNAWVRVGEAFPELEIWLVDVDAGTYETTKWSDWAAG